MSSKSLEGSVAAPRDGDAPMVGIDAGATLIKLAIAVEGETPRLELFGSGEGSRVAEALRPLRPRAIGVTGGGARSIAQALPQTSPEPTRVGEFEAWHAGAARLLAHSPDHLPSERQLLVSLGTGTSILLLEKGTALRVGGTALGGGTVLGLGAALTGTTSFTELCSLARRGRRQYVDLCVGDIYPPDEVPLPGDLTAASFAKLGRLPNDEGRQPADLVAAIMGLVGENVALICCGLAAATQVERVTYGGTTLRDNPALVEVLTFVTTAMGRKPTFLPDGEFAGALGALSLA